ncbi:LysE family translocator [Desertimonas flava]|uniref:LysE family translocator n=1 Tax=Desertimonas flava TaxID=2064846 RepID=UPI000E346EE2|nr:LysE family translocator [Desertimonas flava]
MNFWGFFVLTLVLVWIPGPAVTLVMKRSLVSGRAEATKTALGVLVADCFWALASILGLTAIVVASQPVFQAIRLVGAAYLCWLGLTLLRRGRKIAGAMDAPEARRRLRLGAFSEGALCDLSNPKTLLVFTSVIPQFLPSDGGSPMQAALLGATFAIIGFMTLMVYGFVFSSIGLAGLRSRLGDALLRLSGAFLMVFGVRLATEPSH